MWHSWGFGGVTNGKETFSEPQTAVGKGKLGMSLSKVLMWLLGHKLGEYVFKLCFTSEGAQHFLLYLEFQPTLGPRTLDNYSPVMYTLACIRRKNIPPEDRLDPAFLSFAPHYVTT